MGFSEKPTFIKVTRMVSQVAIVPVYNDPKENLAVQEAAIQKVIREDLFRGTPISLAYKTEPAPEA